MSDTTTSDAQPTGEDPFIEGLLAESGPEPAPEPGVNNLTPPAPEPREPAPQREPERVPINVLLDERDKRQAAERRIAEFEAAERQRQDEAKSRQAPEIWADPNAWAQGRIGEAVSPLQQQMQAQTLYWSNRSAIQEHGQDAVNAAVKGLAELRQSDPAEFQRLEGLASRSMDPVGDVVRWHKQQATLREIGPDPAAYRKRLEDELLASPDFLARAEALIRPSGAQPRADNGQFAAPAAKPSTPPRAALPSMRAAGSPGTVQPRPSGDQSGDDLLEEVFNAR